MKFHVLKYDAHFIFGASELAESRVRCPFLIVVYGEKQGSLGHLCSMKTPYLMIAESLYVGPNVLSLNLCSGLKDVVMVKFVMFHMAFPSSSIIKHPWPLVCTSVNFNYGFRGITSVPESRVVASGI